MLKFCPGAQMFGINLNYSKNCSSDKLRYCFHIQYSKKYKLHKDCHMPVFSDDFITVFHLNSVVPCVPLCHKLITVNLWHAAVSWSQLLHDSQHCFCMYRVVHATIQVFLSERKYILLRPISLCFLTWILTFQDVFHQVTVCFLISSQTLIRAHNQVLVSWWDLPTYHAAKFGSNCQLIGKILFYIKIWKAWYSYKWTMQSERLCTFI